MQGILITWPLGSKFQVKVPNLPCLPIFFSFLSFLSQVSLMEWHFS